MKDDPPPFLDVRRIVPAIALVTLAVYVDSVFLWTILGASGVLWLGLDLYERRMLRSMPPEGPVIYCEWASRLNDTDFDANEPSTISGLRESGFSLESAIGTEFAFHTEPGIATSDIWFGGKIVRNDSGKIVIRADSHADFTL